MSGSGPGGFGGSLAGTFDENVPNTNTLSGTAWPIMSGSDRLYASLDEMIFRYPVAGDSAPRTNFPNPNLSGTLAKPALEELKFFLTANSCAPELTPFNTPKVSMWPQWMTAADRHSSNGYYEPGAQVGEGLLAFCSAFGPYGANPSTPTGKFEYFIQRYSAGNASLQDPPPSYSSCTADWDNVPRNPQLANYLVNLGSLPIPGYGAAFTGTNSAPKYNQRNFSNIALEAIDYIRGIIDKLDYTAGNYEPYILPLVVTGTTPGGTLPGVGTLGSYAIKGYGVYPVCTEFVLGGAFATNATSAGVVPFVTPFVTYQCFLPGKNPTPASFAPMSVDIGNPGGLGLVSATAGQPLSTILTGTVLTASMGDIGDDWQGNWHFLASQEERIG